MFVLEMRRMDDGKGRWIRIWETQDGADAASYLKQVEEVKGGRPVEYRMVYEK